MNFIIRNLFLIFVLLCAVACSSDENFDQPSLGNIDFRVSLAGQSRVVIQKDGSGDFQVGDEVALRVYESQPDKLKESKIPGSDDVCIPDNVPHNYDSHSATNKSEDKKSFSDDWF